MASGPLSHRTTWPGYHKRSPRRCSYRQWSHNALLCLRDEIGLGLLVAENAERCSVTVDKLEWRYGQHFYATIGGYSFEIDGPWWDESTATKWTAHRSGSTPLEAATFTELFDLITQRVNELNGPEGGSG